MSRTEEKPRYLKLSASNASANPESRIPNPGSYPIPAPMPDLWSALCLVAVLEGLFLLVSPGLWKRLALQLLNLPDAQIRQAGGLVLIIGLTLLWWLRH
jgi:uncharacterized protein